jgi:hypothetical protein
LDEAATLARRNLHIGNLAETLEERAKFVLSDVARQTSDKDSSVVWISELIHLSRRIEASVGKALHSAAIPNWLLLRHAAAHHGTTVVVTVTTESVIAAVLRCRSGDAHWAVATVDTLHLDKSTLLVVLVGEPDETVATTLAGHGVGHDLGRLARGESSLEKGDEHIFVNLGTEITNKDTILRTAVITAINEATTRSPVELEVTRGVGNGLTVQVKSLGRSVGRRELDKAVSGVARVFVTNDLYIDRLGGRGEKDSLDEILVHPRLELAHPKSRLWRILASARRGGNGRHVSRRSSVLESHLTRGWSAVGTTGERSVHVHVARCVRSQKEYYLESDW